MTPCQELVIDVGPSVRITTEVDAVRVDKWAEIIFSLSTIDSQKHSTAITIQVNGKDAATEIIDAFSLYQDDDQQLFLGSHLGLTYFLNAILFSLKYSPTKLSSNADPLNSDNFTNGQITIKDIC
jgi:hypothetical protein